MTDPLPADRPLLLLPLQRTLLHRSLPPLLLLPTPIALSPQHQQFRHFRPTRLSRPSGPEHPLPQPVERGCSRSRPSQQDGQHRSLDLGRAERPHLHWQADHQRHPAGQGESMAGGGGCRDQKAEREGDEEEFMKKAPFVPPRLVFSGDAGTMKSRNMVRRLLG